MGEEICMLDPDYESMANYVDVESINAYQALRSAGKTESQAFAIVQAKSRDNSRIPMQWNDEENAGFSTGQPWLQVGKTYRDINVAKEKSGPIFTFYQELIALRKILPIIAEGSYQSAYQDNPYIYAFERQYGKQRLLVCNNFFAKTVKVPLPKAYQEGRVLLSNYPEEALSDTITLKPYQTLAILVD
mgnify:FL=1